MPSVLIANWNADGRALQKEGKYKEAIACFEKAIQECPGDVDSHNRMGVCYYDLTDWDKAIETYREAVKLFPYNLVTTCNYMMATALVADKVGADYYAGKASSEQFRRALEEGIKASDSFILAASKHPKDHNWRRYSDTRKDYLTMSEWVEGALLGKGIMEGRLVALAVFAD